MKNAENKTITVLLKQTKTITPVLDAKIVISCPSGTVKCNLFAAFEQQEKRKKRLN